MSVKELLGKARGNLSWIITVDEKEPYHFHKLTKETKELIDQALAALESQPDFQALNKQLLEACRNAEPLIAGERIANDAFPPTDNLLKHLAKAMEKSEKELKTAIEAADKILGGK